MPKRTVLFDSVGYTAEADGSTVHRYAFRGDEIELSDDEAKRLGELGAVGSSEDLEAQASATSSPEGPVTDESLAAMSVEDLSAHLTQNPDDVDRIEALEQERDKPRKGVLEQVESIRTAQAGE